MELTLNITDNNDNLANYTTIGFFGQKGSGKTVALKMAAEQFRQQQYPCIIFDALGNFKVKGYKQITNIRTDNANKLGQVMNEKWLILDLSKLTTKDLVMVADGICRFMLNNKRSSAVIIDEIGDYLPQSRATYAAEMERLIRVGRNYGQLPVLFASQRPQKVDKNVVGLADYYIFLRLQHYLDRDVAKRTMAVNNKEAWESMEADLMNFKTRECYTYGYDFAEPIKTTTKKHG